MTYAEERAARNRQNVADAATYMDRVKPDWWRSVDPLTFDLSKSQFCICGFNGLDWKEVCKDFGGNATRTAPFHAPWLEPLWLEEIAKRMPAPVREEVLA